MSEPDWHGWKITDATGERSLHVGKLPGRKRVTLYLNESSALIAEITALATFSDDDAARIAMDMIDQLARVGRYAPPSTENQ